MELFLDVLGESLVDTAKMLPFLFLAYLLIEYIEHRHGERIEALLAGGGRWGAVPGALLGCVPQCGFSAIASNFYASRVITLGTLMAVYLATSDEAIPLLVSMPAYWDKLVVLMVIKVVYAVIVGFVLDFVLRGILPKGLRGGYTGHADDRRYMTVNPACCCSAQFPAPNHASSVSFTAIRKTAFGACFPPYSGEQPPQTIEEKRAMCLRHHIALWDTIARCDIAGASESRHQKRRAERHRPPAAGKQNRAYFRHRRRNLPSCAASLSNRQTHVPITQLPVRQSGQRRVVVGAPD